MEVNYLKRYVWLINTLLSRERLTFTEISDLWERSCLGTNEPLSRKTFNNHKAAICKIFGLIIGCDRRTNRHYIENPEVLTEDKVLHWLFNMYSTMNQMQADQTLKERIMLEDVPSGQQWLIFLTQAMHDNHVLKLTYRGFDSDNASTFEVEPYGLRFANRRWYLVARSPYYSEQNQKAGSGPKDVYRVYALDRIQDIEESDRTFDLNEKFSMEEYFKYCCGVHNDPQDPVVRLVIKAYENFAAYLRTLPLHESQRELEGNEDFVLFEYHVKVNFELYQKLLFQADQIEVVEPESVREKMREFTHNFMKYYGT